MRLIDADKLKLCYTGTNGLDDKAEYDSIRKMIDLQPAAYDVDKVVEKLECEYLMCRCKNDEVCTYPGTIGCCYDSGIKKAVEIVKSGGIE